MNFPARVRILAFAGCALLAPAIDAPAQVSAPSRSGEDENHPIDSRHPLEGRQYQTMAALARTLDEIAQGLNREAHESSHGDRSQQRLTASVSAFARRASEFHQRMDGHLASDVRRDVDDVARRATDVSKRIVKAQISSGTRAEWARAIDVLGRMQQVLLGADVKLTVSTEDVRVQVANVPEIRRLGRELDERIDRTRDSMQRNDRDSRSPEAFDRLSADAHRLRMRLEAEPFDGRGLQETIARLIGDAGRSTSEARRDGVFAGDQMDWDRIVDILHEMLNLL